MVYYFWANNHEHTYCEKRDKTPKTLQMSKKSKYVYNEHTLQYEEHKLSASEKAFRAVRFFIAVAAVAFAIFSVAYFYFPTPKEQALEREKQQMVYYYNNLSDNFNILSNQLEKIQEKDAQVHRVVFGIDPIDEAIWEGGVGGADRYPYLENFGETGEMIKQTLKKADKLIRKADMQTASLDSLHKLAMDKEEKLASVPSIKPVVEDKLKKNISSLSGFGIRLHPVHKVRKLHTGIDFTCPSGTAIQATGKGVVERVQKIKSGYGLNVVIDHGYGYKTLYAHMSRVDVKKGDKVTKGQKIGAVGNTGTSTGPHLHYEVRINNVPVNPIDYCLDGLSPEEYKELVSKVSVENQSFD